MDFDLLLSCDELLVHDDDGGGDDDEDDDADHHHRHHHHHQEEEDAAVTFEILAQRESEFHPGIGFYLHALQSLGASSNSSSHGAPAHWRCRSVRWLLKACSALGFCRLTAVLSVNYLDRYLAQNLRSADSWKPWMLELLAVACLSIAAKMEEVEVPLLRDLQVGGFEHCFHESSVQRMELAVMSSLAWRLRSVTALDMAEEAICRIGFLGDQAKQVLSERATELIVGTLAGLEFLEFRQSVVAIACVQCALEESFPVQAAASGAASMSCIPASDQLQIEAVKKCAALLDELVVDPVPPPLPSRGCWERLPAAMASSFELAKWPPSPTGIISAAEAASSAATIARITAPPSPSTTTAAAAADEDEDEDEDEDGDER